MAIRKFKRIFWMRVHKYSRSKFRTYCNDMYRQERRHVIANGIKVSHHALDRYFERVAGYDPIKVAESLTEGLAERVADDGDGKYVINNVRVTVLHNTIVTVDTNTHELPFSKRILANPIRGLKELKELYRR